MFFDKKWGKFSFASKNDAPRNVQNAFHTFNTD